MTWFEWLWTVGSVASTAALVLILVDILVLQLTHGHTGVRILVRGGRQ